MLGAASIVTGVLRKGDGCLDTDNNAADFAAGAPNPRNRATALVVCSDTGGGTGGGGTGGGGSGLGTAHTFTVPPKRDCHSAKRFKLAGNKFRIESMGFIV